VQVICESSGGYERRLVQALARARIKVSLVQANRVRQFARAAGILAKTDRIDAEVLCEFGKVMQPQTVTAATLEQEHLRELESQRRHLTHLLVMEQNRCARVSDASVVRLNRSLINQIKNQIEQLDLLIKEHIEQSPRQNGKLATSKHLFTRFQELLDFFLLFGSEIGADAHVQHDDLPLRVVIR
jgi:transposase